MRDDLHHSLPLRNPWRPVVKAASSPAMHEHLADLMARAVWATVGECWDSPWGASFQDLLNVRQGDMFGQERLEQMLQHLEATAPNHFGRRACEVAYAVLMNGEPHGDLGRRARAAVFEAALEDGIEAVAAHIAQKAPGQHAGQVRRKLYSEIPNCNLVDQPGPKKRQPKPSVEDVLRAPLALSL